MKESHISEIFGSCMHTVFCEICGVKLKPFLTTPILELDKNVYGQCCEECADKNFPGWDDENTKEN